MFEVGEWSIDELAESIHRQHFGSKVESESKKKNRGDKRESSLLKWTSSGGSLLSQTSSNQLAAGEQSASVSKFPDDTLEDVVRLSRKRKKRLKERRRKIMKSGMKRIKKVSMSGADSGIKECGSYGDNEGEIKLSAQEGFRKEKKSVVTSKLKRHVFPEDETSTSHRSNKKVKQLAEGGEKHLENQLAETADKGKRWQTNNIEIADRTRFARVEEALFLQDKPEGRRENHSTQPVQLCANKSGGNVTCREAKRGTVEKTSADKAGVEENSHGRRRDKQEKSAKGTGKVSGSFHELTLKSGQKREEPLTLKKQLMERLNAARFRYLNERLYSISGAEAYKMFHGDLEAFRIYHEGFQSQALKWPINPLNTIIKSIRSQPSSLVIADFGCGDARLARSVPNKVYSFDLVALNDHVTACDMTKVPLSQESVDVAVFCLSLMGTNLAEYLCEANRVLKDGGILKVAEVVSRFPRLSDFFMKVSKLGFTLLKKVMSGDMMILFEFKKVKRVHKKKNLLQISLRPCIYKKR